MFELQLQPSGNLGWFLRRYDDKHGGFGPITYRDVDSAIAEANNTNQLLSTAVDHLQLPAEQKESLRLKVKKALMSEERRTNEERLMLAEAERIHRSDPRPGLNDLIVKGAPEVREDLYQVLQRYPYVRCVYLARFGLVLQKEGLFDWKSYSPSNKAALYCLREKIAAGFGLSCTDHWGRTKAKIRDALLPRANKLLQEASVKRLLDDALRNGQRVLIWGSFVFWYEEGSSPHWVVKQVAQSDSEKAGEALWYEGTILSKNHGRIVVLPYVKDSGERVQGHTKNAPHDGKALPRHRKDYVELPFKVLDGDLMFGLFGDLRYE